MRGILGVIVALLAMNVFIFALSIAPWFILGLDGVLLPGRFDSSNLFNFYAVLVSLCGALGAGWLCAKIGRSQIAIIVLAAICFAGGMVNAFVQLHKGPPGPREPGMTVFQAMALRKEPAWFGFLMPCLGVVGVMLGGRRICQVKNDTGRVDSGA